MDSPAYKYAPIQSVQSVCRALSVPEPLLRSIAQRASNLYIGPKPKPKKNGGIRYVFDTRAPLKPLLKDIKRAIFKKVLFPKYLTGSLSGRDFVANVDIHKGSKIVIAEDIAKFFDCITADHVHSIWRDFFKFSEEVSRLLTVLTTKDGRVFQGTPTSSYLANLVFWEREPALVDRLSDRGIRYSRYVDDVMLSSEQELDDMDKTWAISQIYGMIGSSGFKVARQKHGILLDHRPITLMGLNANSPLGPTLTKRERSAIRSQVFQIERCFAAGEVGAELRKSISQVGGRLGRLKRLHQSEAQALEARVAVIKSQLDAMPFVTPLVTEFGESISEQDSPF